MKGAAAVLALACAALAAGCLGGEGPGASTSMPGPGSAMVPAGTYLLTADCADDPSCYEPTAAFAPDGSLLVTGHAASQMFRVGPDGNVSVWAVPDRGGDGLLQADPLGRVHFTALVDGGVFWTRLDGGNWTDPRLYSHPGALPGQLIDRQWPAFQPDGSGALVYSLASSVQVSLNSIWAVPFGAAGGFGAPVRLATADERMAMGPAGAPAFDAGGRLYVPMHAALKPQAGTPLVEKSASYSRVLVAVLDGSSVTLETVHDAGDDALVRWPALAVQDDVPTVVWAESSGGLFTSRRVDGRWTEPPLANAGRGAATLPWILPGPAAGPTLVWYEEVGDGPQTLRVVARHGGADLEIGTVHLESANGAADQAFQNYPTTDFAYAAVRDGALAVPWYDRGTGLHVTVAPAQST